MVEVVKAEKNLNIIVGIRAWPLGNSLDSSRIYTNTSLINKNPEIFYFELKELVFLQVSIKLSPFKAFNNKL